MWFQLSATDFKRIDTKSPEDPAREIQGCVFLLCFILFYCTGYVFRGKSTVDYWFKKKKVLKR